MASHLTITSATAPARAFGGQAAAAQQALGSSDTLGIFAALLGSAGAEQTTVPSVGTTEPDLSTLLTLGLDATFGQGEGETKDPQAVAAPVEAPLALVQTQPQAMVDFIDALADLKASIDRGETPDSELVGRIETKLAELTEALGLDLSAVQLPENFAELLAGTAEADTKIGAVLAKLLTPLAQTVETAAANAAVDPAQDAGVTDLKMLNAKLTAFLAALESGGASPEGLTAIGMPPGEDVDPQIEAALARFAVVTQPEEPALAAPALKLTEPVLAGKSTDAPETPAPASKPIEAAEAPKTGERPDQSADQSPPQRERVEVRRDPAAFVAPAANEAAPTDVQPATSQPSSPRVDSAATTRIVTQPGYQTSQQQLNLPQIAFEMARQVEGGNTRFQIRLDPPELGRIDVRLEIDSAGTVNARLTVEKSETLDLMQRDQRGLERALQQAGLDANKTNLEFSLKQNPFAGPSGFEDGGKQQGSGRSGSGDKTAAEEPSEPAPSVSLYRGALQASGVNIIA